MSGARTGEITPEMLARRETLGAQGATVEPSAEPLVVILAPAQQAHGIKIVSADELRAEGLSGSVPESGSSGLELLAGRKMIRANQSRQPTNPLRWGIEFGQEPGDEIADWPAEDAWADLAAWLDEGGS